MANELGETVDFVRKGDFSEKNEGQLRSIIRLLRNWRDPESDSLISAVENEIARRQQDKRQESGNALHESAIEQGGRLHNETMDELKKLKTSVDQLARARCVDKWILIASWIAAIAALAAVALALKH